MCSLNLNEQTLLKMLLIATAYDFFLAVQSGLIVTSYEYNAIF